MKLSWNWIQDHIKLDITGAEAAELITKTGMTVDEVIEVDGDTVLDIDITTNRPDAMNHRGMARELSAATGVGLEPLDLSFAVTTKMASEACKIFIDNPEGCNRFSARVISNTKNGPSPAWMAKRLETIGMRSINLLVDITNYVMWDLGHPLHGYDLQLVPNGKIVVRNAKPGEKLKLLDGSDRVLDESILVIADESRAIGLAGIMGGFDTEINDNTRDILLECAHFDAITTRRSARKLQLSTDASYRFERGMDVDDIATALDRCCHFYHKLAGGEVMKGVVDEYPKVHQPVTITMNHDRLCQFAGADITRDTVNKIFTALDFTANYREKWWKVTVPSRRVDLTREADLFEEIIRVYGYDTIPPTLPNVDLLPRERNKLHAVIDEVDSVMLAAGYDEAINYDFIDPTGNGHFAPEGAGEPIVLENPIATPHMSVMRQSIVPSLVNNIRHNHNHGNFGVKLFETARIFFAGDESPIERTVVGIAADGAEPEPFWSQRSNATDLFEFKGVIEYLFTRLGLSDIIIKKGHIRFLDPSARADILRKRSNSEKNSAGDEELVGYFGLLSAESLALYGIDHPVFVGQLDLGAVLDLTSDTRKYSRQSKYPSASRDLSFTLPGGNAGDEITYQTILDVIENNNVEELVDVRLIDRYSGEATSGETSMAIRLTYQHDGRTMTQEEVDAIHTRIKGSLEKLGLTIR